MLMFHEAFSKTLPGKFSGTIKVSWLAWQLNLANQLHKNSVSETMFICLLSTCLDTKWTRFVKN